MHTLNRFLTFGALALLPAISFAQVEAETPVVEIVEEVAAENGINWIADFDEAQAIAKATGKDMLVDFTGSDWCGWCWKLEEEVYDFESFKAYAAENFVMVLLDFPNSDEAKALVPNAAGNEAVMNKYNVTGFPTVLLMEADGEVYGRTGYRAGGPEEYVKFLALLKGPGRLEVPKANQLLEAWKTVTDENRSDVYGQILAAFTSFHPELEGRGILIDAVMDVFTFDAKNELGLKLRAVESLIEAKIPSEALYTAAAELDPENASGLKLRAITVALSGRGLVSDALAADVKALDPKNAEGLYELLIQSKVATASSVEQLPELLGMIAEVEAMGFKDSQVQTGMYFSAVVWNWKYLDNSGEARRYGLALEAIAKDDEQVTGMLTEMFGELGREAAAEVEVEEVVEEAGAGE